METNQRSNSGIIEHVTHLRVRYADTDQMGMVYYAKYFEYFEVARTEMLRAMGLPYAEIEAAGFWLPVSEASAKYHRSARYDDLIRVTVRMPRIVSPRLEISYEARLEASGDLLAEGATTLVFVSAATGKPTRPPKIYSDIINTNEMPHPQPPLPAGRGDV